MSELSDFVKKQPNSAIEVDIEMVCQTCMKDVIRSYVIQKDKMLIGYCEDNHESKLEGFNFI